ncbi:hypothetical protein ACQX25_10825 [Corynebacterium diphtheriae]|uniref:hypothetical protein n=1 Tax=Corynebacterium diphtheriae TaxID=1717 RepID=UPI000AA8FB6B|nr:hypothetical protein [Corynebacterium diphtheriae]MBG9295022.1 hypothetical protein [Corynebacterium diphtheriae bv. mitis]MBG9317633.1 hypothetical protein [Corynebacterium diphtheriae bv. mitis]MBG9338295.1 hypothetical protein [Corynebacterium diphtheriae bv. mitis]MBG9342441.1 hypothetical protein [Corynebacterium diphtheriae]MBG9373441.1 hypothetical protein [Corynebacterium diphtheriae bv. gravis]
MAGWSLSLTAPMVSFGFEIDFGDRIYVGLGVDASCVEVVGDLKQDGWVNVVRQGIRLVVELEFLKHFGEIVDKGEEQNPGHFSRRYPTLRYS